MNNISMKDLIDLGATVARENDLDGNLMAEYMSRYEKLLHMDLTSSERVYPITIGFKNDEDTILIDENVYNIAPRIKEKSYPLPMIWLDSGMAVTMEVVFERDQGITGNRFKVHLKVDDGNLFSRYLRPGERIWVNEEMFNSAFYPFTYSLDNGHKWRVPFEDLKLAIELVKF